MTYARVINGVVTKILHDITQKIVFTRLSFKLAMNKRIDLLEVQPEVGWTYDEEEGFSAP